VVKLQFNLTTIPGFIFKGYSLPGKFVVNAITGSYLQAGYSDSLKVIVLLYSRFKKKSDSSG